jgi:hypothetical protein
MKFFLPDQSDEIIRSEADLLRGKGIRAIRKLEYDHDSSRFVVEIGKSRQEYRRKTGPRGGYIKNAGYQGWANSTGNIVNMILKTPTVIEVYSVPGDGWAFPSLVGGSEITGVEYFDPWDEEDATD